jgi:hypothetical protein
MSLFEMGVVAAVAKPNATMKMPVTVQDHQASHITLGAY